MLGEDFTFEGQVAKVPRDRAVAPAARAAGELQQHARADACHLAGPKGPATARSPHSRHLSSTLEERLQPSLSD